jgi:hypothetical protein
MRPVWFELQLFKFGMGGRHSSLCAELGSMHKFSKGDHANARVQGIEVPDCIAVALSTTAMQMFGDGLF